MRTRSSRRSVERRLLILVLCAPLLGLVGVLAAEVIPDGRIAYHLLGAEQAGIAPVERPTTPVGTTADQFTECTAFSVGLGEHRGENFLANAMLSPTYVGCEKLEARLRRLAATNTLTPGTPYLRYWHGYAVLTRPALGIFGVAGTRWIAFAALVAAAGAMVLAVHRAFGVIPALLLVGPAVLTTDMIIGGFTTSTALGMATAWLGGWICFRLVRGRPNWPIAGLSAAVAGTITAYVDLLTTTPGAFAAAVVGATLGIVAAGIDPALHRAWLVTTAAAVGWAAGFVWMWVSKWVIAAAVLGPGDVIDNVRSQIGFRLSGDYEGVDPSRVHGLTDNLDVWWHQPLTPWVVIAAVLTVAIAAIRSRRPSGVVARTGACCAIVAIPALGWYVALNNHSQTHFWLVYRSLPIAFGALCTLAYAALSGRVARHTDASVPGRSEERAGEVAGLVTGCG
jgi:hypothetical protein